MPSDRSSASLRRRPVQAVLAVVVLAVLGLVAFQVFERFEQAEVKAQASEDCPGPAAGGALPLDLPSSEGVVLRRVAEQGRTTAVFADTPGGPTDIVTVRDRILDDLRAAGYQVVGTDQEMDAEAEAEVSMGSRDGTLRVKPLCTGTLEVRYAINS